MRKKIARSLILKAFLRFPRQRETGFEPATFALARRRSTPEPLAHNKHNKNDSIVSVAIPLIVHQLHATDKRETGFEPATFALARRRSTPEPLAHLRTFPSFRSLSRTKRILLHRFPFVNDFSSEFSHFFIGMYLRHFTPYTSAPPAPAPSCGCAR